VAIRPLPHGQYGQVLDIPGSPARELAVNPHLPARRRARVWESSSDPCCRSTPATCSRCRSWLMPLKLTTSSPRSASCRRILRLAPQGPGMTRRFATLGRQDTVFGLDLAPLVHPTGPGWCGRAGGGTRSLARVFANPDVEAAELGRQSPASASASRTAPITRWSSSRGSPTPPPVESARSPFAPRQQGAVDGDTGRDGTALAPAFPARPGALVGAAVLVTAEKTATSPTWQRLERGHRALVLRDRLRPRGGQAAAPRIGVREPGGSTSSGRGPPQASSAATPLAASFLLRPGRRVI